MEGITISTKNPESRWAAIDINNKVLCEGMDIEQVVEEAKLIDIKDYFLMWIPLPDTNYYFNL